MRQAFTYEVVRELGHLGISDANRWDRLVRLVSWNGRAPKADIRQWAPSGGRMGRGVSLSREEAAVLVPLLRQAYSAHASAQETSQEPGR